MMQDIEKNEFDDDLLPLEESQPLTEPTVKKRKPREPKIKTETLDPSIEAPKRKPRGKKASPENTARQLMGIHKMIATMPNMAFMELQENEALTMANAMIAVAEEYDVSLSGKAGASIQMFAALGMVYVPRALYFRQLKKAKALDNLTNNLQETAQTPNHVQPSTESSVKLDS